MTTKHPLGITVLKPKLDVVRTIAAELGFKYSEESTTDCNDSVRFNFGSLSDEQTMKLVYKQVRLLVAPRLDMH